MLVRVARIRSNPEGSSSTSRSTARPSRASARLKRTAAAPVSACAAVTGVPSRAMLSVTSRGAQPEPSEREPLSPGRPIQPSLCWGMIPIRTGTSTAF